MSNEIDNTRVFLYDLLKSFFANEPDEKIYSEWFAIFDKLKKDNLEISEQYESMLSYFLEVFKNYNLDKLKNEYYELFVNPFNDNLINLNASYYLDGKNFGETLVSLRGFIWDKGIAKDDTLKEPEDSVVFMSDVMIYMIKNMKNDEAKYGYNVQKDYFDTFLEPFFDKFSKALKSHETAYFYACCGMYLDFLTNLEKSFLNEVI
ncbi:TorD/DmsD family molecular chaperone [Deferribacter abyssi]|uniref:TorD/DmsD family molecular chaperone n=1 Tax=Deferribacter abyssi TaxID=213806 RepID=UPI003C1B9740